LIPPEASDRKYIVHLAVPAASRLGSICDAAARGDRAGPRIATDPAV
jgi:hypothetical protein